MRKQYELVVFGDKDSLNNYVERKVDKTLGRVFNYNSKAECFEWPNGDRQYLKHIKNREDAFKISGMTFSRVTFDISLGECCDPLDIVRYCLTRVRQVY